MFRPTPQKKENKHPPPPKKKKTRTQQPPQKKEKKRRKNNKHNGTTSPHHPRTILPSPKFPSPHLHELGFLLPLVVHEERLKPEKRPRASFASKPPLMGTGADGCFPGARGKLTCPLRSWTERVISPFGTPTKNGCQNGKTKRSKGRFAVGN